MKKINNFIMMMFVKYQIKKWQFEDWCKAMDKKYNLLHKRDEDNV